MTEVNDDKFAGVQVNDHVYSPVIGGKGYVKSIEADHFTVAGRKGLFRFDFSGRNESGQLVYWFDIKDQRERNAQADEADGSDDPQP